VPRGGNKGQKKNPLNDLPFSSMATLSYLVDTAISDIIFAKDERDHGFEILHNFFFLYSFLLVVRLCQCGHCAENKRERKEVFAFSMSPAHQTGSS